MKLLLLAVVVAAIVAAVLISKKDKSPLANIATIAVDCITMELLVSFFKQSEIIEKLRENKKLIAAAIKEQTSDGFKVICTLFDTEANNVVSPENCSIAYTSKELSDDVKETFGDKAMIVLQ